MNAKTNCAYCALLLTLIGAPFQAGAIGPELQGTVKNLGDANQNNNGVAGVSISIKDKNGKEIGSGLTDAKGNYKIGLLKQPSHLTAYFDKLGFQSRPTIRQIPDSTLEQKPVFLVQEGASSVYYKNVATSIAAAGPAEKKEKTGLVAALPETDRSYVKQHLMQAGARATLDELKSAENMRYLASTVKEKLLPENSVKNLTIEAGSVMGSVLMGGFVNSLVQKKQVEAVVKSVDGVHDVQNNLKVEGSSFKAEAAGATAPAAAAAKSEK